MAERPIALPPALAARNRAVVKSPHETLFEAFARLAKENRRITRGIALSVISMNETTIQSHELIAEGREFTRRLDRVLKWR